MLMSGWCVADNSIQLIQSQQAYNSSLCWVLQLPNQTCYDISKKSSHVASENKSRHELDFLRWRSVESMEKKLEYLNPTHKASFFSIKPKRELNDLDQKLCKASRSPNV